MFYIECSLYVWKDSTNEFIPKKAVCQVLNFHESAEKNDDKPLATLTVLYMDINTSKPQGSRMNVPFTYEEVKAILLHNQKNNSIADFSPENQSKLREWLDKRNAPQRSPLAPRL